MDSGLGLQASDCRSRLDLGHWGLRTDLRLRGRQAASSQAGTLRQARCWAAPAGFADLPWTPLRSGEPPPTLSSLCFTRGL